MIIKKMFSFLFVFAFIVTLSVSIAPKAQAAQIFPNGCSSAIGYSIVNGSPCNGSSTASSLIAGCPGIIGYSITTGIPCSGTTIALPLIDGCNSSYGYSITNATICNGTNFVSYSSIITPVVTPGLPVTGVVSMSVLNIALLSLLGLFAIGGVVYTTRKA